MSHRKRENGSYGNEESSKEGNEEGRQEGNEKGSEENRQEEVTWHNRQTNRGTHKRPPIRFCALLFFRLLRCK